MRFAPYRSNCGAATAARFLHLFKFGLVVFRRETFGDGRQSRRLPAVFFFIGLRLVGQQPSGTGLNGATPPGARRLRIPPLRPETAPPEDHPEKSTRTRGREHTRQTGLKSTADNTAPGKALQSIAPRGAFVVHKGAFAPAAPSAPGKGGARIGFCTRFAPTLHDCGLSNRREVSSFIKFGLVVFRRETFGDGRQS